MDNLNIAVKTNEAQKTYIGSNIGLQPLKDCDKLKLTNIKVHEKEQQLLQLVQRMIDINEILDNPRGLFPSDELIKKKYSKGITKSDECNKRKLPKPFIDAHNIVLEGLWEQIRMLLEENPEIRKMYPVLLNSLKPSVKELYRESYSEYKENIKYKAYYSSILDRLKGVKMSKQQLIKFLAKTELKFEDMVYLKDCWQDEDGRFNFEKDMEEN